MSAPGEELAERVRAEIAVLQGAEPPIYLDSAASSLTPEPVLEAVLDYYRRYRANIHRGRHAFAEAASDAFEEARADVAALLGARPRELIFTAGATAGIAHLPVDVETLGADYLVVSAHKMLGPTGVGALWASLEGQDRLAVEIRGGGAVRLVEEVGYQLKSGPQRFEAGTPPIAEVIGFGAAARYLAGLEMEAAWEHERALGAYLVEQVAELPGLELIGPPPGEPRLALASLIPTHAGLSADHLAMVLSDRFRVMVRSGHHCCHPFFDGLGAAGALRVSGHVYSTRTEVDQLAAALAETVGRLVR